MNKTIFVLPFIIACLLAAIWSGWIRIGVSLPVSSVAAHHGSLMINGFLASLIFLERAVTFKSRLALLLPALNTLSIILQVLRVPYAEYIYLLCDTAFIVMCIYFINKYKELYYYVFLTGAFCLLAGNIVLYKTQMYPVAVVWWMEFLLFSIVAERLELTRFLPTNKTKVLLLVASLVAVFISGFIPFHQYGGLVFAISLVTTAIWLLKYDMAFKSIKAKGQHKYSGLLLIVGYCWIIITSVLLTMWEDILFGYDALIHSFFIGFVFSMIFSHAPIILPAVSGLSVKIYRPVLYLWFILLQFSLIARMLGNVCEISFLRKIGGIVNGIVMILFFVTIAIIMFQEIKKKNRSVKA